MTLFKNKYRIASTRLRGWDYTSGGIYFVTICTKNRECFFGEILDHEMNLSPTGEMACENWLAIPKHTRGEVELDEFVIMPNHVHGIIVIHEPGGGDVACNVSTMSPKAGSLGAILRSYKSSVSRWCGTNGNRLFGWQERYFDEIIRNESAMIAVRQYIAYNPANWDSDRDNLAALRT